VVEVLLGSLVSLSAALYNGFPLVTSDTGTYIYSAANYEVPSDRPVTYGLFIRLTSLHFSYWLVIWAQCLLLTVLLLRCIAVVAPGLGRFGRLGLLGLLAWVSGFAWYSGQLMPDIFTATGLLALGLLVLGRFHSWFEQVALLATLLLCAMMHNSNVLSYTLACLGVGALAWQQRLFGRGLLRRAHWLAATTTVLAAWLVLPALHATFGGGFTLSRASPVFLLARFIEGGVVDRYLAEHCHDANAPWLCEVRDQLPNDAITFLWDDNSPYNKSGGLKANLEAYRGIVRAILTSPRYYPQLASMGAQSTLRQLTHVGHGDGLWANLQNSSPYNALPILVPYEMKPYLNSMQNHNALHFEDINARTYAAQLLSLVVLLLALAAAHRGRLPAPAVPALLLLAVWCLGLVANAFVVGTLANVIDRLQGRAAWLLPLGALLLVVQWLPAEVARLRQRWWPPIAAGQNEPAP
jgi:hypothetical protein